MAQARHDTIGGMTSPAVVTPDATELWPPHAERRTVLLGLAATPVERDLIARYARGLHPETPVTFDAAEAIRHEGASIAPVGVAWLPPERGNQRLREVIKLADELSPRLQQRILDATPGRCRIVVGEPAQREDLADRWRRHTGATAEDGPALAKFVGRQARLAVDRAERGVSGSARKTARDVVEDLASSRAFRDGITALAGRLGRDEDEVAEEARADLEELATEQTRAAQDVWERYARFLWSRAYELEVDTESLERLRELNRTQPLVFLPTHKSNLDGYVMSSVLHEHDFPKTHVLGGINMAFWPLGALGRKVGVIWIRRSFGGDEVYKYALRRYLAHLASKRFNLEWYLEGGRSRTGKLLPPKMGLLNYFTRGVEEAGVPEAQLVPVSIVYDHLAEVVEMTAESRGAIKQAEGIGWLLRFARQQRGSLGKIHVRFGEPVALREALAHVEPGDEAARSLALSKAAFEVLTRMNRATPATAASVTTLALLGARGRALTLAETQRAIEPVLRYVRLREIPADLHDLDTALDTLAEHGVVEVFAGGREPVYRIGPDRELAAAFFRNVSIHWFVNRAIVELALVVAAETDDDDPVAVALEEAFRLRDLLKFDFFFADKATFQEELRAEVAVIDPAWRESAQGLGEALAASGALLAHRVLRSFVESYSIAADQLVALGDRAAGDTFADDCLAVGRQFLLQGRVTSGEAVSKEFFKTAYRLAENRDLVAAGRRSERQAFAGEVGGVLRRLDVLAEWDAAR
ncbi:MAG: glycerol-3-phosphate O-acyltransferase [Solirubrobacteraceae bacterium]|nr:glycerol-3-phosphate O-acyltransferase [Solirubrobacteraceae bacterium]